MNWLERARREIAGSVERPTANTAEGNPTTATSVFVPAASEEAEASFGSNGSVLPDQVAESQGLHETFEERAGIMEYDGGMSRKDAERAARLFVVKRHILH